MASKQNDKTVQETNNSSIVSKHSTVDAGYFHDAFVHLFSGKESPRRTPLINRGYYIRYQVLENLISSFIREPGFRQILSLGAGFDTAFYRLKFMFPTAIQSTLYVETDFPNVIARKTYLLGKHQLTSEHKECLNARKDNYQLIPSDLSKRDETHTVLITMEAGTPTFVLSECVLTYMNHVDSTKLIHQCCNYFKSSIFVTYEQVCPHDPFGIVMQSHFKKLNSQLKSIEEYPKPKDLKERYKEAGYKHVDVFNLLTFWFSLPPVERLRIENLEFFDEFEEWFMKCYHYVIIIARMNRTDFPVIEETIASLPQLTMDQYDPAYLKANLMEWKLCDRVRYERSGHASCIQSLSDGGYIVITQGGFGNVNNSFGHKRQNSIELFQICNAHDKDSLSLMGVSLESAGDKSLTLPACIHHSMSSFVHDNQHSIYLHGGRMSPTKTLLETMKQISLKKGDDNSYAFFYHNSRHITDGLGNAGGRWRHSTATENIDGHQFLIISGGRTLPDHNKDRAGEVLRSVVMYNLATNRWSALPDLLSGRHSHTSVISKQGDLLVMGGLGMDGKVAKTNWILQNWRSSKTSKFAWQEIELPLIPTFSSNAHLVGDQLLIVGGVTLHGSAAPLQICNLNHPTSISTVELPAQINDQVTMFVNHTSHVIELNGCGRKFLLVLGGGGNCFSFGTHLNKHPVYCELTDFLT